MQAQKVEGETRNHSALDNPYVAANVAAGLRHVELEANEREASLRALGEKVHTAINDAALALVTNPDFAKARAFEAFIKPSARRDLIRVNASSHETAFMSDGKGYVESFDVTEIPNKESGVVSVCQAFAVSRCVPDGKHYRIELEVGFDRRMVEGRSERDFTDAFVLLSTPDGDYHGEEALEKFPEVFPELQKVKPEVLTVDL
jgi:hypothetical protein